MSYHAPKTKIVCKSYETLDATKKKNGGAKYSINLLLEQVIVPGMK
jgi:hypothetical protein